MDNRGQASVEEILESIKKVIARDQNAADNRAAHSHGEDGRDPLDLGQFPQTEDDAPGTAEAHQNPPLTKEETRKSMRENLDALAVMAQPGARPQIVRSGETSLEGLVSDMLRPMLAQWLDDHMPAIVENMVQDEIRRITGKKGG